MWSESECRQEEGKMDNSDRRSPSMDIYAALLAASRSWPVTEQVDGFVGADWLDTDISGSHMVQVTRP